METTRENCQQHEPELVKQKAREREDAFKAECDERQAARDNATVGRYLRSVRPDEFTRLLKLALDNTNNTGA